MTSSARRPESLRVAVFAKAPVPGAVKTRLQGLLGTEGAAALHAALVRRALATAVASGAGPVELHCAPDVEHAFFAACAREFNAALLPQRGANLGERMRGAFEQAFGRGEALLVIGTDCPALGAEVLRAARDALRQHDAVIVPSEDGGYVLIGLARPVDGVFDGVDWGSEAVLAQTRARFAHAKVRCIELATLWDVDRPEDYRRMVREGLLAERRP